VARRRWWFRGLQAVLVVAAVGSSVAASSPLHDLVPPIGVRVAGTVRYLHPSTTFGQVVQRYGLTARSGDLLDVQGLVLQAGIDPGLIALNGREAPASTRLQDGDRIRVINGRDRTETTVIEIAAVPGGQAGNPQFFLGTTPGERVTTLGRFSRKVVSVVFRPTGPRAVPQAVALTFDDGPSPMYTPQILDVLERLRAPATFFLVGDLVERYPRLVRREVEAGMALALHSQTHPTSPAFAHLPPARMREEITGGMQALAEMGLETALFRPPGGSYSQRVVDMAERHGLRVVLWSIDPRDWRDGVKAKWIARKVLRSVGPGSIILLHDGGGDQSATVNALPKIIRGIRKMGLRLVRMGPALGKD
jgi:peptidoglycan/xylan/chitin deacetylase (PgdA/CDA1 family)